MSATTKDPLAAPSTYEDVQNLAAQTPLTEEAKIHLRAAAFEAEQNSVGVRALLNMIRSRVDDGVVGGAVTLSDGDKFDVAEGLRSVGRLIDSSVVSPIYERGVGDRPHKPGRSLTLDEEEVWAIGEELERIACAAACVEAEVLTDEEAQNCGGAAAKLAGIVRDRLFQRAGIPVGEETSAKLYEAVADFAEEAKERGFDAAKDREGAES